MTRLNSLFAQVYTTSAILAFVATFLPLWSSPDVELFDTMSLWEGAVIGNHGGDIAAFGLMLALLLVTSLVASAVLAESVPVLPGIAAVLSLPGVYLLLTKPYSSTPEPSLGTGGALMLALAFVVILTAISHVWAWVLANDERREQVTPLPAPPV
ncbi:hypothetical protein [Aeromicrobium sp. Leaf350]|uniref:hypothetical protein n=1 Tax=Aeromicrobium sp. Leaf350 TaxID=2876565 RepID=UPI001E302429|nr:hypothetical protein [Aeromicrobium sp. Leaf350]